MTSFFKRGPFSHSSDSENDVNFQQGGYFPKRSIKGEKNDLVYKLFASFVKKYVEFYLEVRVQDSRSCIISTGPSLLKIIMCLLKEVVF